MGTQTGELLVERNHDHNMIGKSDVTLEFSEKGNAAPMPDTKRADLKAVIGDAKIVTNNVYLMDIR